MGRMVVGRRTSARSCGPNEAVVVCFEVGSSTLSAIESRKVQVVPQDRTASLRPLRRRGVTESTGLLFGGRERYQRRLERTQQAIAFRPGDPRP